jgi:hypothetical protein
LNRRVTGTTTRYRFSGTLIVRLFRSGLLGTGLVLLIVVLAIWSVSAPGSLLLVAPALLLLLVAGISVVRSLEVLVLDDEGYRVRWVRGAGVRQARWREVEDVVATEVSGASCVVLRLRDGRHTTVPVGLLRVRRADLLRELQQRLNHGHGYRPLPRRG